MRLEGLALMCMNSGVGSRTGCLQEEVKKRGKMGREREYDSREAMGLYSYIFLLRVFIMMSVTPHAIALTDKMRYIA
jgi:hypothetical protein